MLVDGRDALLQPGEEVGFAALECQNTNGLHIGSKRVHGHLPESATIAMKH